MYLAGLLLYCCALGHAAEPLKCPQPVTHINVTQGEYYPQPGTIFELRNFRANMVSRGKASPMCFLRWTEIIEGQVFVRAEGLTKLFDRKVEQSDSSISDIKIETEDEKVHISGKVKKLLPIPFSIEGPVTTDGRTLAVQAKSIKAIGIPIKGLLGAVGKELSSMIKSESVNGVAVNEDTLIFKPENISHVRGFISNVVVTEKGLTVTFSEKPLEKGKKSQVRSAHDDEIPQP